MQPGTASRAAALALGPAMGALCKHFFFEAQWLFLGLFSTLTLCVFGVSLRLCGVELGRPELTWEQHAGEAVKVVPVLAIEFLFFFFVATPNRALEMPSFVLIAGLYVWIGCKTRGVALTVLGGALVARGVAEALVLPASTGKPIGQTTATLEYWSLALCSFLGAWTKYLQDQRLLVLIGAFQMPFGILGHFVMSGAMPASYIVAWVIAGAGIVHLILLTQRRLRNLPPGLKGVRFVRLGFVRGRGRIVRYQAMPAGGFGDVTKAMHLVSVSHRWLDPHTCDVPTQEFPDGLRVSTMRRVLNSHFSPTHVEEPSVLRRLRRALSRTPVGGFDAVLFFDFCGLPQVPRSDEEERMFSQCLPHMGMLYSMFPTMVLHDVTPGAHAYLDSGWCFCELETARLGKQLLEYSSDVCTALGITPAADVLLADAQRVEEYCAAVDAQLEEKQFRYPSDKQSVRNIIRAYALKCMVLTAIDVADMERLHAAMARLKEHGLTRAILDQPLTAALDTPLHLAVRKNNAEAVKALLHSGANPTLKNLRGDCPSQLFMAPRWNAAARLARSTFASKLGGPPGPARGDRAGCDSGSQPQALGDARQPAV